MRDSDTNTNELAAAEQAICRLASDPWFRDLTPPWRDFLVTHTVETFHRYEVTMDQAAQKLVEFYVEVTLDYPEAKTMNPWEARLPAGGDVDPGDA